ncbi:gliding motility lipoprotein GldB [Hymenobacter mucosus]|uniref:Gliding motility-associated lipoprotein GldB n=1 Tax=Hymenobacter mucosus TaxID=1411120 RepID=A0A239B5S7_9BACT|nr:hypothetical protein [Hymenobacter mucosus]SNS03240.1 gliding motility-associated lipoprotein GldB [Hymenobacter mucosus]
MHIPARIRPWLAALIGAAVLVLPSCNRGEDACELDPEIAKVPVSVQLERLEVPFFQLKNNADVNRFVETHPLFARQILQVQQYPAQAQNATLLRLASNPDLRRLYLKADSIFTTPKLEAGLKPLFQHIRYYFPSFQPPLVETFVTGLSQHLFVNDSLLMISPDFFVGPTAKYRPQMPDYMLRRYTPDHLMPTIALAISSKYNQKQTVNPTMLSEMVYYGKSLYFAEKVLPCTADSLLIGYTNKEMAGVAFNESKIWAHFIEKSLLYNTESFTIQKYVGERPNIPEIDKTCPGRVGAWVGWQIVRKYMAEHPAVTLRQLMSEKNAQRILSESRYRPKPRRAER